jgi:hypothetical protein
MEIGVEGAEELQLPGLLLRPVQAEGNVATSP